jgi:secreted PhoX family phosphatase
MAGRFDDEFAGATFGPGGNTLFVNIQASRASRSRSGAHGPAWEHEQSDRADLHRARQCVGGADVSTGVQNGFIERGCPGLSRPCLIALQRKNSSRNFV